MTLLLIYLLGVTVFVIAFLVLIIKEKGELTPHDLIGCLVMSLFSWPSLVLLLLVIACIWYTEWDGRNKVLWKKDKS